MAKQTIVSNQLYPVYGPYSHAVRAGEFIFTHGTVGFDAQGQLPGRGAGRADMAGQCQRTLENLGTALELLGGTKP
jgi:enamine deaminase RidA (YjgF/YER057c/UK114 family)